MRKPRPALFFAFATMLMSHQSASPQDDAGSSPVHVRSSFEFEIAAPLARTAPLFGPEGERRWAGEQWNPVFIYPRPPQDIEGAVFHVQHGSHQSVWVNTLFDLSAGRFQYVYFIPDAIVSTVDVRLGTVDPSTTRVEVTYSRTALSAAANDRVLALGASDRGSGPRWQEAIADCLKQTGNR